MSLLSKQKLFAAGIVTVAIASMTLTTAINAKERGNKADHPDRTEKQFNRLDSNEDGVLVLEELTTPALTKAENGFIRKDADEDGFLTFEEATSGREPQDYSDIAEDIAICVADLKEETGNENIVVPDPDAYLSPQEKFDAADTSGDSLLDLAEVQANATSKATTAFTNMDSDEDAQVTLEEFQAHKASKKATRRAVKTCIDELTAEEVL